MAKPEFTRILSIDGGGIRGIIPGRVLVALEQKLQSASNDNNARIADYFDLIAGTSTGGILACLYLCPQSDQRKRPKYTAQDAVDLYLEKGDEIFDIPIWHRLRSADGLRDEKYPADGLEEALDDYLGDLKLDPPVGRAQLATDLVRATAWVPIFVAGCTHPEEELAALEALTMSQGLAGTNPCRWGSSQNVPKCVMS